MRYIIGIDLGTTNSSVAYIDTENPKSIFSFKIPQLIDEGQVGLLPTLPSFCYLAATNEWPKNSLNLPWRKEQSYFVGRFAQLYGAKVPSRLVHSAKSWLCHPSANRKDKILPPEAGIESNRISPIEATSRYLRHIKEAWNELMAKGKPESEFDSQEIIITVPASFDEIARTLTIEAAKAAGFAKVSLLEEPQAAFYSWISQNEEKWEVQLNEGATLLVCDIGGGTTDFSLIKVVLREGKLGFQRMSVGNHLLLGGDNMDAALAYHIEEQLAGKQIQIDTHQRLQIYQQARLAKEVLLETDAKVYRILLQGSGSKIIQNTLSYQVEGDVVKKILLDGFFGTYPWDEALELRKSRGLRSMGLPYEDESSIIKHLASFLKQSGTTPPQFVLFNGGAMKPQLFQNAILSNLKKWFPESNPQTLSSYSLDLAVSRGAAYYGMVRLGKGIKIGGGSAQGFYLLIDVKGDEGEHVKKALTLLPRGSEEGSCYEPKQNFFLTPNTPVSFQSCTSHTRLHDKSGDLVDIDPSEMHFLPPIQTVLKIGKQQSAQLSQEKIPVHLNITLTPIGTLELYLKSLQTEHQWKLEFQVRTVSGLENNLAHLKQEKEEQTFQINDIKKAQDIVTSVFVSQTLNPNLLIEKIEEGTQLQKREWPSNLLRKLADSALDSAPYRNNNEKATIRWWNFLGFCLRPGFGYPLDDYRIKEVWKLILSEIGKNEPSEVQTQLWICYRRICGGMNKGQQMQLASQILGPLRKDFRLNLKTRSEEYLYSERIRAVAAMELIDDSLKVKIGETLVARICQKKAIPAEYWALGRIGARHLLYGSFAHVVSSEVCTQWMEKILNSNPAVDEKTAILFEQLGRKTEHLQLNIPSDMIQKILVHFKNSSFKDRLEDFLLRESRLTHLEKEKVFGDELPLGLTLS